MKKMFSMSVLTLMALIALHLPCVVAQEAPVSVDESIASVLDGVEAEPVAAAPVVAAADDTAVTNVVAEPADATVGAEAPVVPAEPVDTVAAEGFAGTPAAVEPVKAGASSPGADGAVRVSMAFEDSPLPEVVRAFRDASGANIISGWTNTTPRLVSARLDDVEWSMGLSAIVASYGLELKEEPRGSSIYIIREKITVPSELPLFTETFVLKHAKAETVSSIFQYTLGLSAPAFEATNKTAQAKSARSSKSVTVPFPSANIVVVTATEEQIESCRQIIESLDIPTRQVYIEARFVRLNASASKKLGMKWDSLSNFGASITGLRGGLQVSDAKMNGFDVTATDASRSTAVSATGVKKDSGFDVTKTTSTMFPEKYTGATISGLTTDDLTWKKASGFGGVLSITDFGLAMSAFEQMDGAQIFSNPKIIVENETKAKVDMTTKEPNVEIDYQAATQTGQRDSISSKLAIIPGKNESWVGEAFFSYGISLEVTPRISPSGLITIEIIPSISQKVKTLSYGVDQAMVQYPVIAVQRLDTTFTMGDGKTAVIGGLTETTENNIDSGIPLLRKIPWIGPRLFGWKSREKTQNEIIVFVTVGIIDGTTIKQDVGMPKNAVLGRGLLDGTLKEPGDRTDAEMFNLEQKLPKGYRIK